MPLEFHGDAICLSGVLGSKLKSLITHKYYNLWWRVTSGGPRENYAFSTAIIEMNAGTGELYIEDTDEVILGSAGAAMDLKFNNRDISDPNLTIILVEKDKACIKHLKNVINRRFPRANIIDEETDFSKIKKECVLIRKDVEEAIETINQMKIRGRCIFFFDPLLSVDMDPIRKIYKNDYLVGLDSANKLPNYVKLSQTGEQIYNTWQTQWNQDGGRPVWNIEDCWPIYLLDDARGLIDFFRDKYRVDILELQ